MRIESNRSRIPTFEEFKAEVLKYNKTQNAKSKSKSVKKTEKAIN